MAIKQETVDKYTAFNWKAVLREDLGESGKLNEIDQNLQRIKQIFDRIFSYQSTLEQVPNYERTFESAVNSFIDGCQTQLINGYSDVTQKPDKLAYVRQLEESLIGQLSPIFNYLQFVDPANNTKQQELDKKSKEMESKLKDIDTLTKKVQKAVEISGNIAEGQEVSLYGKEFETMATNNKEKASRNQNFMMLALLITTFVACIFVFGKKLVIEGEGNTFFLLWNTILEQNVLLKIFIISAGGYLVAHFSRNYSAEMHMYYMNKHRQMALNSHQRILDAVKQTQTDNEPETKNAILLQVAKTMFEAQESGYLKNGNNPVPTTQIIETVRSGASKS